MKPNAPREAADLKKPRGKQEPKGTYGIMMPLYSDRCLAHSFFLTLLTCRDDCLSVNVNVHVNVPVHEKGELEFKEVVLFVHVYVHVHVHVHGRNQWCSKQKLENPASPTILFNMKPAYTFDDIALVPQFNNIASRTEPSLETWLTTRRKVKIPIVNANMDAVIGTELADLLIKEGTYPIFHRFADLKTQSAWVKKYKDKIFVSCGLHNIKDTKKLLEMGPAGVCVDVAHGHSSVMLNFISSLKKDFPDQDIIAGNVCTPMAYHDLVNAGADAIKVGIGPGAACTTRIVTGFGVPQFTAIRDCASIAEKLRVPLIADGGIRSSRELVLALAAGASTVMIGKLFALTKESAAPKRKGPKGKMEVKYRGQASEDFQNEFYGGLREKTVPEGIDFWAEMTGTAQELLSNLLGGLRSGMTYGGARNIKELQRKAEFVSVQSSYMLESKPRA